MNVINVNIVMSLIRCRWPHSDYVYMTLKRIIMRQTEVSFVPIISSFL